MAQTSWRVLVAEDDRFLRKAASTVLRREGYAVLEASDGEEALRVAQREQPDVVLLDLIMPKMQGFEVLRALKRDPASAHIPVIVLSNLGQERDVQQAVEDGAVAYYVKAHLSLSDLVRHVDQVVGVPRS